MSRTAYDQNTPLTARGYDPFLVDLCWTCVRLWSNNVVVAQSNICPFSLIHHFVRLSSDFRFYRESSLPPLYFTVRFSSPFRIHLLLTCNCVTTLQVLPTFHPDSLLSCFVRFHELIAYYPILKTCLVLLYFPASVSSVSSNYHMSPRPW